MTDCDGSLDLVWPQKQPLSELDYTLDLGTDDPAGARTIGYDAGFGDDYIVSVEASIRPSGAGELSIDQLSWDGLAVTGRFVDGVAGRGNYLVRYVIDWASGQTLELLAQVPMGDELSAMPILPPDSLDFSDPVTYQTPGLLDFRWDYDAVYAAVI